MKSPHLVLAGLISLSFTAAAATNETLYQTSFEPDAFQLGLPIRGQDGWEMFHNGEAISICDSNANSGAQCLRMEGGRLELVGPNASTAYCFSRYLLDHPEMPPPPLLELSAYVRLDGPQTGTSGAPEDDLMSANFAAVAQVGTQGVRLGEFLVSSAGKIFTVGSRPEDKYRFSAPMTFGAYHKLALRVDFIARTVRYFVDGRNLGFVPFA